MSEFQPLAAEDPRRLGAYDIVARLGEGGQGIVYLGRSESGEQAAVKLLHHALVADPEARARFLREVAVAQRVARFCTATVLHADLDGSRPYIVSEYVPGPSLRELVVGEGPRRGAALERLAISTATALAAIHRAGILHRDFKPANVLMGPEGPVVIDFGIARALDSPGATATGMAMGTPSYLAPEQLTGTSAVSEAADVFAWGVTMVFAATGKPAFGADSIPVVMNRILHEEPQLGAMEGTLGELVAACLSKDPAQRPTADELITRLTGQPVPRAVIEPVTGPTAHLSPAMAAPAAARNASGAGTGAHLAPAAHAGGQPGPGTRPGGQLGPVPETGPYGRPSGDGPVPPPGPGMPPGAGRQGMPPGGPAGMPHGAGPQGRPPGGPRQTPGGTPQGPGGPRQTPGGTPQGPGGPRQTPGGTPQGPGGPHPFPGSTRSMPGGPGPVGRPGSFPGAPHGPAGPGQPGPPAARPTGSAGAKQRRTLTFALSGAAAAALVVVAGAVLVQANMGTAKVSTVGAAGAASPSVDATQPADPALTAESGNGVPSMDPSLERKRPEPTKTKTERAQSDGLAQVPDPATNITGRSAPTTPRPEPATPRPKPSPSTSKKPTNQVDPEAEPTNAPTAGPTTTLVPSSTSKPTPTLQPNPYRPTALCGSGYKVIDSHGLGGVATIYLLWNKATSKNCVVTMSAKVHPAKVQMNVVLKVKGDVAVRDSGKFAAYAGPLRRVAAKKCIIWGGSFANLDWKSGWSHCA